MSLAALLVALALPLVSGHSYVQYITTGKQNISAYLPYDDPWDEIPKITRPFSNNSPVEDVDSPSKSTPILKGCLILQQLWPATFRRTSRQARANPPQFTPP
jgi:hypothetical protein